MMAVQTSASPKDVFLIQGLRTPFVKAGAKFKNINAVDLGCTVLRKLLDSRPISSQTIDEVIAGNVGQSSDAANIARVIALRSGLPEAVSAFTVSRNCASGMESITSALTRIQSGFCHTVLAGGVESMSSYPLLFSKELTQIIGRFLQSKTAHQKLKSLLKIRWKDLKPRIALLEGLTDPFVGLSMGETAEVLAGEFGISREDQDQFALNSHQKALQAQKSGRLSDEIVSVLTQKEFVHQDIGPRANQSLEKLQKLKPYFDRRHGSVTVGNACPITDGACFLLMMSREQARRQNFTAQIKIRSFAYAGCSPSRMGLGPVYAAALALKQTQLTLKDIDLIEINEAFSAQVLACLQAFSSKHFAQEHLGLKTALGEIDPQKLNVNGGAVALGHPVGATGARLILTLMKEMKKRQTKFGLAALCIGGGQGGAVILENVKPG